MPTIPKLLKTGCYYHVFNRGVEKRRIYLDDSYYQRFIKTLDYYQRAQAIRLSFHLNETEPSESEKDGKRLVSVLCYCLMPNHYHLVLKQLEDGGITKFMNDIANSYTRYFNTRLKRSGHLFQGGFKSKLIDSQESFLQVSRYIHLNPYDLHPEGARMFIKNYPYSSYRIFLGLAQKYGPCLHEDIKGFINSEKEYREFVESKIGLKSETGIESLVFK